MKLLQCLSVLFLCFLAGCAADETASTIAANASPSPPSTTPSEPIIGRVTYKPFASGHDDKFSLGDFDSPYLLLVEGYRFATNDSRILLNNLPHEVNETDYKGDTYLGITNFRFSDYTDFLSTNDTLTIKVSLVEVDGTYTLSNETVAMNLTVTKATNIYTWQDLQGMKHDLSGKYVLRTNITFPDGGSEGLPMEGFDPVGDVGNSFMGSFAGNGYRITNLSIDRPTRDRTGIWGLVNSGGSVIKDFVVDHAGISGADQVGAVMGRLNAGMVNNVRMVSSGKRSVSGNTSVGGLIGLNNRGIVAGYVTGAVSGMMNVGGLVGSNSFGGTVIGYATGSVSGNDVVGGLVGYSPGGTAIGYATGRVTGTGSDVGGLVGNNAGFFGMGMVTGYWDTESTGQRDGSGFNAPDPAPPDPPAATFTGVGIPRIANVVLTSTNTYWDGNTTVFDEMDFLDHFTLPGRSGEWPKLNGVD